MTLQKSPAFQLYANDFLSGTRLMSRAAVGAYITMLCTSWDQGPIPNTPQALQIAMGLSTKDAFRDLWNEVKPKWNLVRTGHKSGWINRRLEVVRKALDEFRMLQSEKGKLSAAKRWGAAPDGSYTPQGNSPVPSQKRRNRNRKGNRIVTEPVTGGVTELVTEPVTGGVTERQPEGLPKGLPKSNSSIFDLRSLDQDQNQDPIPGAHGTPRARARASADDVVDERPLTDDDDRVPETKLGRDDVPPNFVQQSARGKGLVDTHLRCDRIALPACARGWCVPAFIVRQWLQQLLGRGDPLPEAEAAITAFVARVCESRPAGPLGDDPLKFWRATWLAEHGSQAPVAEQANTREARILAAARRTKESFRRAK